MQRAGKGVLSAQRALGLRHLRPMPSHPPTQSRNDISVARSSDFFFPLKRNPEIQVSERDVSGFWIQIC